jgi:hypothetical protein
MGCGCKGKSQTVPVQPTVNTVKINEVAKPIVTQPAAPLPNNH